MKRGVARRSLPPPRTGGRRCLRAAAMGVCVVALSATGVGCGSAAPSPQASAQQQAFLNDVHETAPDVNSYRTDVELSRLGKAVCDDLRSGASYETVADRLATTSGASSLPSEDLGAVITAAAQVYCPQYADRLG